ncbi:hypothetical protein D9M72_431510 [compost metagenome]
MKPAFCKRHGVQNFILTSSDFSTAIEEGRGINVGDVRVINTSSFDEKMKTFVDKKFFNKFFKDSNALEVFLFDREKHLKKMNDRLLIRKIFSDPDLKFVCPACLREALDYKN